MENKPKLDIAVTTASDYILPVVVLLKSLFANNTNICITVNLLYLTSSIKEDDISFLEDFIHEHGQLCRRVGVTDEQLKEVPDCRQGKDTFLRLLLPKLLPEVTNILYLDGDIIVNDSLSFFCSININDKYLICAKDSANFFMQEHCKNLGLPENVSYFNAGVLFMNLELMRRDNITSKLLDYMVVNKDIILFNDQDILNGVLWEKIVYFPPKYNMNWLLEPDVSQSIWTKEDIREAKSNPAIVHYIGPVKPWNYLSYHPQTKLWWKYLRMTPFKDYRPANKTFKNFFRKIYLSFIMLLTYRLTVSFKRKIGKLLPDSIKQKIKKTR
ncbi:LPS 1,2-glucosyltransferase [Bacteroidia bacterium]|nr:LPS 1,2-glucosyltransferase [Bacteroidia bacterium]